MFAAYFIPYGLIVANVFDNKLIWFFISSDDGFRHGGHRFVRDARCKPRQLQ